EEEGLAKGFVQSVTTPSMQFTDFCIHAPRPIQLVEEDMKETAESVFVLDGVSESHFPNLPSPLQFNKNGHNLQYNSQFGGSHVIHSSSFHAFTITYDLPYLKQLLQNDTDKKISQLTDCLYSQKTYLANNKALTCGGRIAQTIGSIRQCSFSGVMRYLFLESKMMELFALQMEQLHSVTDGNNNDWKATDKDKLHSLKHYIENAYLDSFSLKDLTYQFGLNEFKLKKGYKQFFQTTVFGHVHQLRLQKAKMLLEEKTMNVTEAAFFIGYNNVSSFCTEFKKRFGYSPGRVHMN
ncbi:MAG TPA: AraC family transcriptional regulator, partial [Flavisolibacter sp.]|nr:AraC family transcriptional regulator [Flavisolibacter sp.]